MTFKWTGFAVEEAWIIHDAKISWSCQALVAIVYLQSKSETKPVRRKVDAARAYRDSEVLRFGTRCEALSGPLRAHRTDL